MRALPYARLFLLCPVGYLSSNGIHTVVLGVGRVQRYVEEHEALFYRLHAGRTRLYSLDRVWRPRLESGTVQSRIRGFWEPHSGADTQVLAAMTAGKADLQRLNTKKKHG